MVIAWSSHPSHQLKFFFWITSVSIFTCQTSVEDRKFWNGKMYGCCYWAGCMDEWLTGMQMSEPQRGMFVHGFTSHLWVSLCCCTLYFQEFFVQSSNQMTCVNVMKLCCWSPIILQCPWIDWYNGFYVCLCRSHTSTHWSTYCGIVIWMTPWKGNRALFPMKGYSIYQKSRNLTTWHI